MTSNLDIFHRFSLSGHTALVTGVGPGIGSHVATAYARAGARVVVCARTPSKVDELVAGLTDVGHQSFGRPVDVGDSDALDDFLQWIATDIGIVDVVFNNAAATAITLGKQELDLTDKDLLDCYAVNVLAPFRITRALAPAMTEAGWGTITNVLSTAAFTPVAGMGATAYGATKAALQMQSRYLAKALAPAVRVNCICPGTIDASGGDRDVWTEQMARIPMGRVGMASEVVEAALFLASDASSYITGQTIFVDGGRVATVS